MKKNSMIIIWDLQGSSATVTWWETAVGGSYVGSQDLLQTH